MKKLQVQNNDKLSLTIFDYVDIKTENSTLKSQQHSDSKINTIDLKIARIEKQIKRLEDINDSKKDGLSLV